MRTPIAVALTGAGFLLLQACAGSSDELPASEQSTSSDATSPAPR